MQSQAKHLLSMKGTQDEFRDKYWERVKNRRLAFIIQIQNVVFNWIQGMHPIQFDMPRNGNWPYLFKDWSA